MTHCNTDPFQVVADLADAESGFFSAGPCSWGDSEIAIAGPIVLGRPGGYGLSKPPPGFVDDLDKYTAPLASGHQRASIGKLQAWAGDPLRLLCRCECGHRHTTDARDSRPGWVQYEKAKCAVNRRLVALALQLASPDEQFCKISIWPTDTNEGPVRIRGTASGWWAVIMGMGLVPSGAPRYKL